MKKNLKRYIFFSVVYIFFLFTTVYSADIIGKVSVETGENFGVFIYVDGTKKYDITDSNGRFKIEGLEKGKEYLMVFQKEDIPDYKKVIKIKDDEEFVEVELRYTAEKPKYKTKVTVMSEIDKDIFLNFKNKDYGIILKPNKTAYRNLEEGEYKAEIMQDGAYVQSLNFKVEPKDENNAGIIKLKPFEKNEINLLFENMPENKVVLVYRDNQLKYSENLKIAKKYLKIKNLEEGKYKLVVKAYGYNDFESDLDLKGEKAIKVLMKKLENPNAITLRFYPEKEKVAIRVYDGDALILEEDGINGTYIFKEADRNKKYLFNIISSKYKKQEYRDLKAGDIVDIGLVRDTKGIVVKGNVFPFASAAEVMILDEKNILAKGRIDDEGRFEIEAEEIIDGEKLLRVSARGFKEKLYKIDAKKGKVYTDLNFELEPLVTTLYGKVSAEKNLQNVLVIIEELNIWQHTNQNGEYIFKNIPKGIYTIAFKKLGYADMKEKAVVVANKSQEMNITMKPQVKLIIKSNEKNYDLFINGEKETVKSLIYEKILSTGEKEITARKKDYLEYKTKAIFEEAGQEQELKINFINLADYKNSLKLELEKIRKLIEELEIEEAEKRLLEYVKLEMYYIYKDEFENLRKELIKARRNLFNMDRKIRTEIENIKKDIENIKNMDISYGKKREKLDAANKAGIEYIHKILKDKPYTALKYDLYTLEGDIYTDMGMLNSAKDSYKTASKYKKY